MRGGKSKAAASRKDGDKVAGKRKAAGDEDKKAKRGKVGKDANKPKRPPSAFFVFMEEFRKTFKEKHPDNKKVSVVSKAGGNNWKSMSEAEKAPYVDKAAKRKAEYEKSMVLYNKKQSEEVEAEGSDKSKSEVDDEEDGDGDGEEEEDEE
ncbi:unnamed protein product [Musa acuminata subsp. malaccensis]|uniref:(wild Malaysian banana) hypothetical protein n=1 Tax=Musa acuminata subsp. malaccensis TaxID=214687 RepID=A0A804IWF7_MUSAM|nr:PREDICTED: HMG1/2-like protein [Musa acuminata subsp. malaccensis]CAG1844047.1 unnamed protein product [Musa acuminata subsp. malaccensis]